MIKFLTRHPEKIYIPLLEHIQLVFLTLVISVAIAAVLTLVCLRSDRLSMWLQQLLGVVYSIPSLALFAIMIPVTGLGRTTAVIALTAYNQYLLLRNFTTGLREVDPAVTDAAKGIGMTWLQVLTRVQIPLAKRALFAGIRLAVVSTIGIGTIAASINAGGLGTLLFDGLRTMNMARILWGSLLSAGLAIATNALLKAGFDQVILDAEGVLQTDRQFDRVLELIGPATLRDTFSHVAEGGIVCSTGQLGGQWYLNDFDPIMELPANGYLTSFYSGNVDPARLQSLLDYVQKYGIDPAPERVFSLPQVPEAHAYLESTHSFGKVIVVI